MTIHAKLIEFHKQFGGARKTGLNPHFGNQHFTLDDVIHATTPILSELGLYIAHYIDDGQLVTVVADEEGDSVKSSIPMALNGNPQAAGSMVTYYKRYNLCALLNIAEADDDGNAATVEQAKPIDEKTLVRLREELESLDRDEAKFCKYIGVDSLENMPVGLLPKAERAIKQAHEALKK